MNERGFKGIWMCAAVYLADDDVDRKADVGRD